MEPIPNPQPEPVRPADEPQIDHAPSQIFTPGQSFEPTSTPAPPPQPAAPPQDSFTAQRPIGVASMESIYPSMDTHPADIQPIRTSKTRRFSRRSTVIGAALLIFLLGAPAAAYFGYMVPNKPENVWSKALINTGKGYDKLSSYAENQFGSQAKGVKLDGSFKISGTVAADGSFQGKSDADNGEFTGSVSATGLKMNLDTRVIKSTGNSPDIYFKVDGIQGLGTLFGGVDPQISSALNGLNGNWYFVDHTLFDQYAKDVNSGLQFSSADIKAVLDALGKSAKQYVFTSDTAKTAFTVKQQVGRENQDGRKVYHYKVGVNKNNLKAFNNSLCDSLKDTKLFKLLTGNQTLSSCKDTSDIDNIKDSDSADVWVDLRTKLIHKIRFTDKDSKDSYFDIGQDYQGGDSFPFSLGFQSKSNSQTSHGTISLVLNTKTNTLNIDGNAKDDGSGGTSGSFKLAVSPNNTPVKVDKPANAKTIIQLLNDLGFGDIFGQIQGSAKDTERKTDINALSGQLEAYAAENGYYPTLADINSASWRSANMKGLDAAALQDPDGTTKILGSSPKAHLYSYQAIPSGCDNVKTQCLDYTLTATLDNGTTYVKQALIGSDSSLPDGTTVIQN